MFMFYCVNTASEMKNTYRCVGFCDYSSHSNHQTSSSCCYFLCNASVALFQLVIFISIFTIFTLLSFDHTTGAVKFSYTFLLRGRAI